MINLIFHDECKKNLSFTSFFFLVCCLKREKYIYFP